MKQLRTTLLMATALAVVCAGRSWAQEPYLSPVFSDNMVIQRDAPAPVWGWTTPGAKVTVSIAGKTATGVADSKGKWMAKLPPLPVGGPYTMKITGPTNTELKNVLVGDVWVCSGQSNMEMGIGVSANATEEIAAANYPQIRLITVQKKVALEPQTTFNGTWDVCTPQTVAANGWGGFSAVGYYFGRELNQRLKIPIGLIHTSWGGTIAEAWTSAEALNKLEDFRPAVAQVAQARQSAKAGAASFAQQMQAWWEKNDPGSAGGWAKSTLDAADWKTMTVPTTWENAGLPDFDGIVWFRKVVELPDSAAGKAATLHLGPIDDRDTTYVNGVAVGSMDMYNASRDYKVPAGILKAGKNVIAVRVLDTGGGGGIYGNADQISLDIDGESKISLVGDWSYKVGADLKKLAPTPIQIGDNPNVSTVLYNGMIAPLLPLAIKGAIWYQGESNAGRAYQYRSLLPTMIRDWRSRFSAGEFPFFIVQLANFQARQTQPVEDSWAELREAQLMTAQTVGKSGIAVITDIGDAEDIHPKDKQNVGKRLALQALSVTYGQKNLVASGPIYKSMKKSGNAIHLTFDSVGGGLIEKGAKLEGFAIAGPDHKFVWADAKIVGNTVVVSSPSVSDPAAVRYAWAINPIGNLFNKEGLPASPFRTDTWPGITVNNK